MDRPFILLLLCRAAVGLAGPLDLSGQASGWAMAGYDTSLAGQAGLRYIPSVSAGIGPLDAEVSANGFATAGFRQGESASADARLKPYRAWLRLSTARFEARAGLQKVNFGSALMLRPLQWFDRIDPRDPLAFTDGVYALLARYWFQNNANLWVWGLLGNSSPKGMETFGSERWTPEFGGRAQLPVPRGEIAFTGHHRTARVVWVDMPTLPPDTSPGAEDRVGLDGKWDLGVGLWCEVMVSRMNSSHVPYPWQRAAGVGLDYTFGLGNGLLVTAEHLALDVGTEPFRLGETGHASAALVSYPLGLVDNLRGIVFFDWAHRQPYAYVSWQRTLDNWIVSLAAFWNPDQPAGLAGTTGGAAGKGLQLTVVFNH